MMKKAGYIERSGLLALDEEGVPREMICLHIQGKQFGVRADTLVRLVTGAAPAAYIERIEKNWQAYIGAYAGKVRVSKSGKALNIEFADGNRYTLSIGAVHRVIVKRDRFASIVEIPVEVPCIINKNHLITEFGVVSPCPRSQYQLSREIAA